MALLEIKELSKHIYAILRVGKEYALSREDIELVLELGCRTPKYDDFMFKKAISLLLDNIMQFYSNGSLKALYYLRKPPQKQENYFYD